MEQYIRELYCSRIIAGYVRYNKELRVYWPNKHLLYEASEIYQEAYEQAREEGLLTTSELISELVVGGLYNPEIDVEIQNLSKEIDGLKVQCYHNIDKPKVLQGLKNTLGRNDRRLQDLANEKHKYDHLTCEGVAVFAKWTHILENSVYYKDGRQFIPGDEVSVISLLNFWNESRLSDEIVRELARTEPWQTYWYARGSNIFSLPDTELSDEQRRLVMWSKHYDSIRESMNAPDEAVVQDDDALDGWMIVQKKKREKERTQERIESKIVSDKIRNARDIFIPARTPEEVQQIEELNNEAGRAFKRMRLKDGASMPDLKMRHMQKD